MLKKNWEKEFDKRWYLHNYHIKLGSYSTCGEAVKDFIRQLLKEQLDEFIGELDIVIYKYENEKQGKEFGRGKGGKNVL